MGAQWSIWLMVAGQSWPLMDTKKEYNQIVLPSSQLSNCLISVAENIWVTY